MDAEKTKLEVTEEAIRKIGNYGKKDEMLYLRIPTEVGKLLRFRARKCNLTAVDYIRGLLVLHANEIPGKK